MTSATFRVLDDRDGGVFKHGPGSDLADELLDDAIEKHESGQINDRQCASKLISLTDHYPDFIDGHAHLGKLYLDQGKVPEALEAYRKGHIVGSSALPFEYKGKISWGFVENRPFLRTTHGLMLCYRRLGRRAETIDLMQQMISWNPNDNQGVRLLLGSEYLRAGNPKKAAVVLRENADDYPPLHYELALLLFRKGQLIEAATSLRRGFAKNGYVAEILCGASSPLPLPVRHWSNYAEVSLARHYTDELGSLWLETPGAVSFLRGVHNNSKVMSERAEFLACQEELTVEDDGMKRLDITDRQQRLYDLIDEELSRKVVSYLEVTQAGDEGPRQRRF